MQALLRMVQDLSEGIEQAVGRLYVLSQNQQSQAFTVTDTLSDRLVVQFDEAGQVVFSQPSLHDRRQWLEIEGRLKRIEQQNKQNEQQLYEQMEM